MTTTAALTLRPDLPSIHSLESYKQYVRSIPNLSEEEEYALFKNFKDKHCLKSAQLITLAYLKNVLWISSKYRGYGIPEEDLVQEGNIGLMKSIKNYDLNFNVKLMTYSVIWIKSEIQSYILKNWKLVKIATTNNLRKLFFNYKKLKNQISQHHLISQNSTEIIMEKLGVSKKEVEAVRDYFDHPDSSLCDFENEYGESFLPVYIEETPQKLLEQKQEDKNRDKALVLLQQLNDREQFIMQNKFLIENPKTNKEIAQSLSISAERVRQIEEGAIKKLKILLSSC